VDIPSRDDVLRARETTAGRLHRTPVFSSATLSEQTGARIFLKAELFQRTGSFKPRGILNKIESLSEEERRRGIVSISAGNAAQAVAWAAAEAGIDALVVMWQGASAQKVEATRGYGAEVDLESEGPTQAFARLEQIVAETGRAFVHPYDDPLVIAGHGTLGLEIAEDVPDADVVVVPVGGGGLVSGIATAVDVRIVAVEPERSAALHEALKAGRPVPVVPDSIADGLSGPIAGDHCLAVCRERGVESVLVTDEEIAAGMRFLYQRAKLACEPAGAASTGALLAGRVELEPGATVVSVVSGGNVAAETAVAILAGE
jgi:threonine dehydratase